MGAKRSIDRYRLYYRLFSLGMQLCCFFRLPGGSGSNMLLNRQVLLEVGGFDLGLSCNEDTEVIWRIQKKGYRVDYNGRLSVFEVDHRRLNCGVLRKTTHSLTRCGFLLCGLKRMLHSSDWGYWRFNSTNRRLCCSHEHVPGKSACQ